MRCDLCGEERDEVWQNVHMSVRIDETRTRAAFVCEMCVQEEDDREYRITFAPVVGRFSSYDEAEDAARHSCWGEDREFESWEIELVED